MRIRLPRDFDEWEDILVPAYAVLVAILVVAFIVLTIVKGVHA